MQFFCTFATQQIHNNHEILSDSLPFAGFDFRNAGITTFAQNGNNYFLHTVSRGQSLYSIANMYHVSIDDIVRLNPGSDKQIRVGEALKIPQANSSSSSKTEDSIPYRLEKRFTS